MATAEPVGDSYDVVIVGGAIMGSSIAWFLSANPDFDGSILVVERDQTYSGASTSRTESCIRQQFSSPINVQISQYTAEFARDFRANLGGDPEVPEIVLHSFGYMYLAGDADFAATLRENQTLQASLGAGTRILAPGQISREFPFYNVEDIVCGSHNPIDEGYFDSGTMFDWWKRKASQNGVQYIGNEVVAMDLAPNRVNGVYLATGERIACGTVVNAGGPRAIEVATMAGLTLPVEPRKRFAFLVEVAEPLGQDLPLTIDPSGVHVRTDGDAYLAGCSPDVDPAVGYEDFELDHDIWEEKLWPKLAHRIPAFERAKVRRKWAGHFAYNTLDHNAIVGPHHEIANFIFCNGFSGHGVQQSPAMGRGVSEWITYGEFRSLDLSPLGYDRIAENRPFLETAIIN